MLQHVSDHRGSIIRERFQYLAKHNKNDSIVSVDIDVVGFMAAYSACVYFTLYEGTAQHILTRYACV